MKVVLLLLTCLAIMIMFFYGIDKEIARKAFLEECMKPVPTMVRGCIFPSNCSYYNGLLRGMTK